MVRLGQGVIQMIPAIQSKFVHYHDSLHDWLLKRELSLPLEPSYPANRIQDYTLPRVTVELWERVIFKLITGFDLRRLREMKICHSPRFKQLIQVKKDMPTDDLKLKFNATGDLIRLNLCYKTDTLESYWVDREFSVHITDLSILAETIKNYRVTWCQGKNSDPKDTEFQLLETHPIESMVSENVCGRLSCPDWTYERSKPEYDEKSDTFRLVAWEKSVYTTSKNWAIADRIVYNWVATSLEKRLKEDLEKRQTDPQHQLRFVRNEIYEERLQNLKRRQMVVTACCVAGLVFCALLGIVFFCRSAKGNRLM
jgi:hypothetical protein